MTKINGVSNQEFEKFEKCFVQQSNDKVRNLGPHNCEKQVYSGSQINMMININTGGGMLGMRHCFIAKLPYPLVCTWNFFERDEIFNTLLFPDRKSVV